MNLFTLDTLQTVKGVGDTLTAEEYSNAVMSLEHIAVYERGRLVKDRIKSIYGQGTVDELKAIDEELTGLKRLLSVVQVAIAHKKVYLTSRRERELTDHIRSLTAIVTERSLSTLSKLL